MTLRCQLLPILLGFLAFVVLVDANFILSCRIIESICQDEPGCLDEMNAKFPNCYVEAMKRGLEDSKRAHAYKIYNLLYKFDRIPVG